MSTHNTPVLPTQHHPDLGGEQPPKLAKLANDPVLSSITVPQQHPSEQLPLQQPPQQQQQRDEKQKRRANLPKATTNMLKAWLFDHHLHPYPSDIEKREMADKYNLSLSQINNWFINARRRLLHPLRSKMLGHVQSKKPTLDNSDAIYNDALRKCYSDLAHSAAREQQTGTNPQHSQSNVVFFTPVASNGSPAHPPSDKNGQVQYVMLAPSQHVPPLSSFASPWNGQQISVMYQGNVIPTIQGADDQQDQDPQQQPQQQQASSQRNGQDDGQPQQPQQQQHQQPHPQHQAQHQTQHQHPQHQHQHPHHTHQQQHPQQQQGAPQQQNDGTQPAQSAQEHHQPPHHQLQQDRHHHEVPIAVPLDISQGTSVLIGMDHNSGRPLPSMVQRD
eukprot:m.6409 g.6409  ORF g.6409 m.6409 type:complete len:388 (+) comp2591_c0_seq1:94-1257(+)